MKLSHVLFNRVRLLGALLVLLVVASLYLPASGEPATPTATDRQIAQLVAMLLPRDHLSRHPLDEEMSRRALKSYLKSLDPMKVYFTQADVDAFRLRQNDLSEQVKRGDITFGYTVFKTFLARIDERVALVDALLKQPQDFSVDEEMTVNADATTYAKTETEVRDKWRKRVKYDLLVLKVDTGKENPNGITGQAAIDKLYPPLPQLRPPHAPDRQRRAAGDVSELPSPRPSIRTPTTCRPSTVDNFDIQMRLEAGRHRGLPASRGRLHGGQEDHSRRGRRKGRPPQGRRQDHRRGRRVPKGRMVDVVDMKLSDVVKLIRGKPGTVVRLEVISAVGRRAARGSRSPGTKIELKDSEANGEVFDVGRQRRRQALQDRRDRSAQLLHGHGRRPPGRPQFQEHHPRRSQASSRTSTHKGVDAVVLDLRTNGGGSLTEAINLTGLFIDDGPVVQVKDADGQVQPYRTIQIRTSIWNGPLVVLISKFSAVGQRDLRRRHPGLPPRPDRRRQVHARQGHGAEPDGPGPSSCSACPTPRSMGELKITMQQFYRPGRRQHAEAGRAGRRGDALAHLAPGRGRGGPGLSRSPSTR